MYCNVVDVYFYESSWHRVQDTESLESLFTKPWLGYYSNLKRVCLLLILHLSVGDRENGNHHKQHILNFSDYLMPKNGIIYHWMTVYIKNAKY